MALHNCTHANETLHSERGPPQGRLEVVLPEPWAACACVKWLTRCRELLRGCMAAVQCPSETGSGFGALPVSPHLDHTGAREQSMTLGTPCFQPPPAFYGEGGYLKKRKITKHCSSVVKFKTPHPVHNVLCEQRKRKLTRWIM